MSKSYLNGSVKLPLGELRKLAQFYQNVKTYDAQRNLVDKIGEDGKPEKFLELNFSIFEEGNYGQNVSFSIPQTKEQRESGEKRKYVANGRIFSASDNLKSFVQSNKKKEAVEVDSDDLPF